MAQCSPEGASTTAARVAQMSVTVTSSGGSSPRAWVEGNLELVALAIVHLLGVPAANVQVELVESPSRRLQGSLGVENTEDFDLRVLVTEETNASTVDVAEEIFCSLFSCHGESLAFRAADGRHSGVTFVEVALTNESNATFHVTPLQGVLDAHSPGTWAETTLTIPSVMVVDDFVVALATWVEGPWGSCSTRCGTGVSRRNLSCSSVIPIVCAARSPDNVEGQCENYDECYVEGPCENYDECSSDMCAVQLGKSVCSIVTSVVVVVPVALALCCCGCCLFALFRCCRWYEWHRRQWWIESLQSYATYRVSEEPCVIAGAMGSRTHVTWNVRRSRLGAFCALEDASATEEERSAPLDDQVASPTCPVQEKRCSKRTVRMLDVEEMVGIDVESPSESDDSWAPSKGPPGVGSSSGRHFRWVWKSAAPATGANSGAIEPLPEWVRPAYEDGSIVEYYSCHHDQWCLAVVSLAALHTEPLGTESFVAVIYNVTIGRSKQQRFDVDLRLLRKPLEPHDSVEVRDPSSCAWRGAEVLKATYTDVGRSYILGLDAAGGARVPVPATWVRRRFAKGSVVSVYRGPEDGWVSGLLQDLSSSSQTACSDMAVSSLPVVRVTRNCSVKKSGAPCTTSANWNVDERNLSVCIAGMCECVPAHLMDTKVKLSREDPPGALAAHVVSVPFQNASEDESEIGSEKGQ